MNVNEYYHDCVRQGEKYSKIGALRHEETGMKVWRASEKKNAMITRKQQGGKENGRKKRACKRLFALLLGITFPFDYIPAARLSIYSCRSCHPPPTRTITFFEAVLDSPFAPARLSVVNLHVTVFFANEFEKAY